MVGSEEQVSPVKQVVDVRRLVELTEGAQDRLDELMDTWGSALNSYSQHLEVLNRAIDDSKTKNVNEEVWQPFTDQANREIVILQQQAAATQRFEDLLNRQVPLVNDLLKGARESLKTPEPDPSQPAATQSTRVLPADATVDELRRESERAEAEAQLAAEDARVWREEAERATALRTSTRKEKRRYEGELEFARTDLEGLEREQARTMPSPRRRHGSPPCRTRWTARKSSFPC